MAVRLVVGTFNAGKIREISELLRGCPVEVVPLAVFPAARAVPETGRTFEENAVQKALGLARQIGGFVLAEDSGLEVDALGGRPGVFSARYGGDGLTDPQRVALLLDEMRDVPDARRAARFHCVVALADASRPRLVARGVVEGRIARAAAGVSGFGYDPVFVPDGHERTFAELGLEVKNRMSHRARALAELRRGLDACLADLAAGAEDRNRG